MQPVAGVARLVGANVGCRHEATGLHVLNGETGFEHDDAGRGVVAVTNIGAMTRYWLGASARK